MSEEKLRVLVVGDLVVPTGFSTVLHNIVTPNLKEFDIIGLGVNYKGDPHNLGFPVYPAMASQGNIYGIDRLINLIKNNEFDLLFILNDAWVISYYLDAIKKNLKDAKLPKIVVYFPVDSLYHNPSWYRDFDIVNRAYTYTEFGKKVVKQAVSEMEVGIMPHGTNSAEFYKLHDSRAQARIDVFGSALEKMGNIDDLFIILNANRNQPRKRLDITIEGFSIFAKNKPKTVKLYMHTGVIDSAIDVRTISKRYDVDGRIIMTNLNQGIQKVTTEKLNQIFNACDIGINTSMGEGWGLTNTEHAATGAVQIVPRHSACEELFEDCGILMNTITNYTFDNSQTVGKLVTPDEVAKALELIYEDKALRQALSQKSVEKFTREEYQWSHIAKQWADIFKEVCSDDSSIS